MKRAFSIFCLAALLAEQGHGAIFSVSNTSDVSGVGSGSLRQAINESNTAGGANTISWTVGGVDALASDLSGIAGSTTLDVTNAPSAVTISGAPAPCRSTDP